MKYKVGDTVRVREDLKADNLYDGCLFTRKMNEYKGKIFLVVDIDFEYKRYKLNTGDDFNYSEEMLEPAEYNCDNCGNKNINKRECQVCITAEIKGVRQTPNHWKPKQPEQVLKEQVQQIAKENEDLIHNPSHYTYSKYEPIDVIKAWNLDFDLGNVVKYIARCDHKGNKIQDLNKALEYLQHEIKSLEGNE